MQTQTAVSEPISSRIITPTVQYKTYNQEEAQKVLDYLVSWYKIKIHGYSVTSCGRAWWKSRKIKVPHPTNTDRFGVFLHEIKHIIDGKNGKRFEEEFACDKFALDHIEKLGYDPTEWKKRMRWHSLSRVAMATNRGLHSSKIPSHIKEYFSDIDFDSWNGKKVFVGVDSKYKNITISIKAKYSFREIELLLAKQGFKIERSKIDDSSYGNLLVHKMFTGQVPSEFESLNDVVKHYELQTTNA